MSELKLAAIYRYPVKSTRGETLEAASLDRFGLAGDRRWMLVDGDGQFQSQRSLAALALLRVTSLSSGIRLEWEGDTLDVPQPEPQRRGIVVTVWGDEVAAPLADDTVNQWLSERLGRPLRLVYCPDSARRGVEPGYAPPGHFVAFSDGYPLLVLTEAAVDALRERLGRSVSENRFRPNLLIRGAAAHAEDNWRRIRIGEAELQLVKPCSRCVIPSIDQESGERDSQINRALASYRRRKGVIYFGMNAIGNPGDRFEVGSEIEVLE